MRLTLTDPIPRSGTSRYNAVETILSPYKRWIVGALLLFAGPLGLAQAQSLSLSASTASSSPGGTAIVNLSMTTSGGALPVAVEWTMTYSVADVSVISASVAGTAVTAGKSIACTYGIGTATCIVYGMNQAVIGDGVVAQLAVTLTSTTTASSTPLVISSPLASDGSGYSIPATASGSTISIVSAPTTFTLACPASGTGNLSCTVTLSQAAPAGGFAITLSSNSASLTVPGSVTVPAGSTSAGFTAQASPVSSSQIAVITATAGSVQHTASISLSPPQVSGVSCNPASVAGSTTTTCTVSLNSAAPTGGFIVGLSSNSSSLVVPANVTVPAASTSVPFTAQASPVATTTTAMITASAAGVQKTTSVSLLVLQISGLSCVSNTMAGPVNNTCTISLNGPAPAAGFAVGLSSSDPNLLMASSLTVSAGANSGTFMTHASAVPTSRTAVITATANGVQQTVSILLSAPQVSSLSCSSTTVISAASIFCTITISSSAPPGGFVVLLGSSSTYLQVPAGSTVAYNSTTSSFTALTSAVSTPVTAVVTASANGVQQTASILLTIPSQLSGVSCNPTTITGSGTLSCSVSLTSPAPAAGFVVGLSSSATSLAVPSSVTVASGSTSGSFTAQASAVSTGVTAVITASASSIQRTVSITENAQALPQQVTGLSCTPSSMTGSGTVSCTVSLNSAAPAGGLVVVLTSGAPSVSVPPGVTVGSGSTTATFTAQISSVSTNQNVSITAAADSTQASATISLTAAPTVSALACTPNMVPSGSSATCAVTLSLPAPAGGAVVALSGGTGSVNIPANVTVSPGLTTASFAATASGSVASAATISAAYNSSSQSSSIWVSPPVTLSILGSPSELHGSTTGSSITPTTAPGGLTGSLVVNGSGSVNFAPNAAGDGLYFMSCCANNANAYYKFTGAAVGTAFGGTQGQVTFYLRSRNSFAQRSTASAYRTAFDVRDINISNHLYFFTSQAVNGRLVFSYTVGGNGQVQNYYAPSGTEDTLFGSGVTLKVAIVWNNGTSQLFFNDVMVQSGSYSPQSPTWGATSNFDLGATEFLNFGGFDSSDDVISNFTVGPIVN